MSSVIYEYFGERFTVDRLYCGKNVSRLVDIYCQSFLIDAFPKISCLRHHFFLLSFLRLCACEQCFVTVCFTRCANALIPAKKNCRFFIIRQKEGRRGKPFEWMHFTKKSLALLEPKYGDLLLFVNTSQRSD